MLNRELVFNTGEQDVCEEKDLRYGECQRYPKIEIGVCRSRIDPLMPHGWGEDRAKQYKTTYDESLLHIWKEARITFRTIDINEHKSFRTIFLTYVETSASTMAVEIYKSRRRRYRGRT